MQDSFLFQAFIYLAAAVITVPLAKKLGLGVVLGYIVAGIFIGPYGFSFIGEEGQDVMHFAEFGVVMMLFLVGLELEPKRLWRLRGPILGFGSLQLTISTAAIGAVAVGFGIEWKQAIAIGLILALSSTAIGIQVLSEKRLLKSSGGESAFSVLLFQDIAVIPILAILPLLAIPGLVDGAAEGAKSEGRAQWIAVLPTWAQTLVVLGSIVAVVVVGLYVMRPVFRIIAKSRIREIFTAAALMLVIGTSMVMIQVGLSPALGTFLAGVVLGGSEYRHELESEIDPFKGLLLGLFFLTVGAGIDFSLFLSRPVLICALLGILLTIKFVILFILGRTVRMSGNQSLLFSVILASGGEFAFVLFSYAGGHQVLGRELIGLLILVVALSMAVSPLLFIVWERLVSPRLEKKKITSTDLQRGAHDEIDREGEVIIAGFGQFGNIVGRLLRANGIRPTILDVDSDKVSLLRNMGIPAFYGDASRPDLLLAAGAAKAKAIVIATNDHSVNVKIVSMAQKHFPNLQIMVRALGRSEAYDFVDSGIDHVYRETLDTSLKMGVDVLKQIGFSPHMALRASRIFRRHDEQAVRELAKMRGDKIIYLNRTKELISDLETLLLSELEEHDISKDAAWDVESRRKAAFTRNKQ